MYPCSSCHRHLHQGDARCPFCGTRQRAEASPLRDGLASLILVTVLGASACAADEVSVTPA